MNTGRNDHCPCGSGIKFKKCCINNASHIPSTELMEGVRPRLIEYIKSEDQYLELFKSLKRGQIYLVATEGENTVHMILNEQEYLDMMPSEGRDALSTNLTLLGKEKVVAYTEDTGGFMTYAFADEEVLK
ncbi:protein of unknown function [Shewanella benthica]|uniref:SEC-C motif domain protein n=1 Tax=Shewanella benthica TaxID=43661 RepID=A0A330LYW1_9GAMM|nr:SEC-C metal-binding domain-containing protein [Shewanella benthica]SQH75466.1 protein of unknown function [Shewanella benthica]